MILPPFSGKIFLQQNLRLALVKDLIDT